MIVVFICQGHKDVGQTKNIEGDKGKGKRKAKGSESEIQRVKLPIRRKKGQPPVGFGTFVLPNGSTMFQSGNLGYILVSMK